MARIDERAGFIFDPKGVIILRKKRKDRTGVIKDPTLLDFIPRKPAKAILSKEIKEKIRKAKKRK